MVQIVRKMWGGMSREAAGLCIWDIVWCEVVVGIQELRRLIREGVRWTIWMIWVLVRHDGKVGVVAVEERECSTPRNENK